MRSDERIAVIGLGYVGLPLAVEFAKKYHVVGYDINVDKVGDFKKGIDCTNEVGNKRLTASSIILTTEEEILSSCNVYIITVPTPIYADKRPNLQPMIKACEIVGRNLEKDDLVIFESTVYPGTTEEVCIPILEEHAGLSIGDGFRVGYSPERINPGDKKNRLTNITKVVSGSDEIALERVRSLYESIIDAGVFCANSIKIAESSKVIENAQRDVNIAFMNELSKVFHKMGIDTMEVIEAAATKWNFLPFEPGLVGGHCIGIDPYYIIYKAEQIGYHSIMMSEARLINNSMGKFVVQNVVRELIKRGCSTLTGKIGVLGFTYKENSVDTRNTRTIDIIEELHHYDFETLVYDPIACKEEVLEEYGIEMVDKNQLKELDTIIITVPHDKLRQEFTPCQLRELLIEGHNYIFDLKALYSEEEMEDASLKAWRF